MREHLDTAPVWDVYRAGMECPLCELELKNERKYLNYFLGGSVMEPAVRAEVNEKGFCASHFRMLYDAHNRLGLALMAHTYLKETIARLERSQPPRFRLGGRAQDMPQDGLSDGCALCDRLEAAMRRYEETLLSMWMHESEFRDALRDSKGLCVRHYARLSALASSRFPAKAAKVFNEALTRVTLDNLRRVEQDLEWFTLKFDYRNQDKPWGESRDAVERALNKLRSNAIPVKEDGS